MTLRSITRFVHLWLGFLSGLVVLLLSTTGCILAFQQEIEEFLYPFHHVRPPAVGTPLSPSVLKAVAEKALPGKPPNGMTYRKREKSAMIYLYGGDPEYYFVVHVDPFTGTLLAVEDVEHSFFHFILHGHYYLWLPEDAGKTVTAGGTLVFVVMLLTGLFLWYPRSKGAARQRFMIGWKGGWRRKNYDLHNVPGFYILLIGLTLGITGLVMGFEWFSRSFYWATSGGETLHDYNEPPSDTTALRTMSAAADPVDIVWERLYRTMRPDDGMYLSFPHLPSSPINAFVNHAPGTYYNVDYHYFDRYTAEELPNKGPYAGTYEAAGRADKLRRMNYDIHTGGIFGLAGKTLMFCASAICATLPVTGFFIWRGRKKNCGRKSTPSR